MSEPYDWEKGKVFTLPHNPQLVGKPRSKHLIIFLRYLGYAKVLIWYAFLISMTLYAWGVIP